MKGNSKLPKKVALTLMLPVFVVSLPQLPTYTCSLMRDFLRATGIGGKIWALFTDGQAQCVGANRKRTPLTVAPPMDYLMCMESGTASAVAIHRLLAVTSG